MKLTRKHDQVGYTVPKDRPHCDNCKHIKEHEDRPGMPRYSKCHLHHFVVAPGAYCPSHQWTYAYLQRVYEDKIKKGLKP